MCPVLQRLSCVNCPVLYILSRLSFPGCPIRPFCHDCPVPAALSRLPCSGCPVSAALSRSGCLPDCPVPAVLSRLSCPNFPAWVVLYKLSFSCCPVLLINKRSNFSRTFLLLVQPGPSWCRLLQQSHRPPSQMTVATAIMMSAVPFHHFGHFLSLLALTIQFIRLIVRVLSPYVQYCRPTVLLFFVQGEKYYFRGGEEREIWFSYWSKQ
jgi:hypothetical protein